MVEVAAHLKDHMLLLVLVRQLVFSLPNWMPPLPAPRPAPAPGDARLGTVFRRLVATRDCGYAT
jgi:hypothetical protein